MSRIMYTLLGPNKSPWSRRLRTCSISRSRCITLALALLALVIVGIGLDYLVWGTRFRYRIFQFTSIPNDIWDEASKTPAGSPPIPNIVHYIWVLNDPSELRLSFKFFVSIYSAHLFWRPERIFIHTDASPEVISQARESGTPWTQRILAIPNLEFNQVVAPNETRNGVEIKWLPHKADFLRLDALRKHGGVYIDADVIPLRDIADLRHSGFRNVIGQQMGLAMWAHNYINNGVMMAVPNSSLMTLYHHAAHQFFDGGWDTASIRLLTDLGNRMAAIPSEVLILQPQAFSPMSWQDEDVKRLFNPVLDPSTAASPAALQREQSLLEDAISSGDPRDALAWIKFREEDARSSGRRKDRNEVDFSDAYVLHALDNNLEQLLGKGVKVDLEFVLARRSNYARAVFPAVWHAVQEGVIPKEEAEGYHFMF